MNVSITGANTGIGKVTAEVLAGGGARVWLACRSEEKTRPVVEAIPGARFLPLDLTDLASVRRCAAAFLATGEPLDVLICNAGIGGQRGLSKQGFELQFGVNHLGHFLLTTLLLERLRAPARVVVVASTMHRKAKGIDFEAVRRPTKTVMGTDEYGVSKLANVLFAKELARRVDPAKIHTYALHPGVVRSDIWRRVPQPLRWLMTRSMLTVEDGAKTSLYCASSPGCAGETGLYYDREKVAAPSAVAEDPELARRLWEESERWVNEA